MVLSMYVFLHRRDGSGLIKGKRSLGSPISSSMVIERKVSIRLLIDTFLVLHIILIVFKTAIERSQAKLSRATVDKNEIS